MPADLRLLAGNTGSGVYKDWPAEPVVVDIRGIAELGYLHRTSQVPTLRHSYTPCAHCGCREAWHHLTPGTDGYRPLLRAILLHPQALLLAW